MEYLPYISNPPEADCSPLQGDSMAVTRPWKCMKNPGSENSNDLRKPSADLKRYL
jgi:hypothetical protein